MSSTFNTYQRMLSDFSSPYSIFLNKKYKNAEVERHHKEAYLFMSLPLTVGLVELLLRLNNNIKLANSISLVTYTSLAIAFVGIKLSQKALEKRISYIEIKYPYPVQAQEELYKSTAISKI